MIQYNYKEMKGDLLDIIRQATDEGFKPDYVAGIARGGWIPAVMLAQWFDVPVLNVHCSLRDHKIDADVDEMIAADGNVLLIDDIIDNGNTIQEVKRQFQSKTSSKEWNRKVKTAALWHNINQDFSPDFVGREISRDKDQNWIIFPFEDWWK